MAHGKALIDAALANNVSFFVYSSVDRGRAQDATYIPHFASKHEIETYLESRAAAEDGKMGWFVIRPTGFMETMVEGWIGKITATCWKVGVTKGQKMQFVSVDDIGWFATRGFMESERWRGKYLSLAGWEGTWEEADQVWKRRTRGGMPVTYEWVGRTLMWLIGDLRMMVSLFQSRVSLPQET